MTHLLRRISNRLRRAYATTWSSPFLHLQLARLLQTTSRKAKIENIREAQTILIIKADEIGDVILSTGLIKSIKEQCPKAKITLLVRKLCSDLVRELGSDDEILFIHESWRGEPLSFAVAWDIARTAMRRWRGCSPDWVVIPLSTVDWAHAAYYACWTGAKRICGHQEFCEDSIPNRTPFLTHVVPRIEGLHQVERHRRMLQYLGLNANKAEPIVAVTAHARATVSRILNGGAELPIIAICAGAGFPDKRWPLENYLDLIRELLVRHRDLRIVAFGGKDDQIDGDRIQSQNSSRIINVCGELSLLESAAMLERCVMYVGNDTGPMHLASALGLPVVEILKHPLGANDESYHSPLRFGPRTDWSRILRPEAASPECIRECSRPYAHCIKGVNVDCVLDAVEEGLRSNVVSRRAARLKQSIN